MIPKPKWLLSFFGQPLRKHKSQSLTFPQTYWFGIWVERTQTLKVLYWFWWWARCGKHFPVQINPWLNEDDILLKDLWASLPRHHCSIADDHFPGLTPLCQRSTPNPQAGNGNPNRDVDWSAKMTHTNQLLSLSTLPYKIQRQWVYWAKGTGDT